MDTTTLVVLGGIAASVVTLATIAARAWLTYRGIHVIQCPETRKPAAVRVDTGHAALSALADLPDVRLASCSRWPERAGCDQACVPQIERDPKDTRLDTIVDGIFADQRCSLCGRTIPGAGALEHKPAFRAADGRTIPCDQITPERIDEIVATHRLVCWDCDIAETFRREHPELVIERRPPSRA